jgi:hypothetical protein
MVLLSVILSVISTVAMVMITLYFERRDHRLVELGADAKCATEDDHENVESIELL